MYRAGAFSAQPGTKLLPALAKNGFVIDSSVVKGLVQDKGYGSGLDYRKAPSAKEPWRVSRDVIEARSGRSDLGSADLFAECAGDSSNSPCADCARNFRRTFRRRSKHDMVQQARHRARIPVDDFEIPVAADSDQIGFSQSIAAHAGNWIKSAPAPEKGGLGRGGAHRPHEGTHGRCCVREIFGARESGSAD